MPGVCYNTKGEEYTTLVAKEMGLDSEAYDGKTMIRLRANNGDISDLKKQAMDELSAIGVTFPVHCYHYIKSGSTIRSGYRNRAEAVLHRQLRR